MLTGIIPILIGVSCIVIGILNIAGNLSMIKYYRLRRIKNEHIRPFGKLMGLGIMLFGLSIAIYGIFLVMYFINHNDIYLMISLSSISFGVLFSLGVCAYALIKYTGGIL